MDAGGMERFWDERAREDAYFFVDTGQGYGAADLDRFWAAGEQTLDALLAEAGVEPRGEDRVVEIGCGVGRITRALSGRVAEVVALDVSAEMLARARAHHPDVANVSWVQGDGCSLAPVAGASADGVLSHVVFQHIPDPEITLGYVREMGRVLRPGGWATFQFSNDPAVHRPRGGGLGARLRARAGRAPRGMDHPAWLGSAVELDALRGAAASAGLEVKRIVYPGTQYCLAVLRR